MFGDTVSYPHFYNPRPVPRRHCAVLPFPWQVFWLPDSPTCRTFPSDLRGLKVAFNGFRPRSQRRARTGFSPVSLTPTENKLNFRFLPSRRHRSCQGYFHRFRGPVGIL